MLPTALLLQQNQRFRVIDQALTALPKVVTSIICDYSQYTYDHTYEDVREIVNSISIRSPSLFEYEKLSPLYQPYEIASHRDDDSVWSKLARVWSDDDHPADIIIRLIHNFQGLVSGKNVGWSGEPVVMKITEVDENQQKRDLYLNISTGGETILFDIVAGRMQRGLYLKDGNMSHSSYSNLGLIFRGANFANVNFSGTTFNSVLLDYATFTGCDLTGATFNDCNLEHTEFSGSKLEGTTFRNLRSMSRAVFNHVIFNRTQFTEHRNWPGYTFECRKVVATDELFLAKLTSLCTPDPKDGTLYLNKASFEYTSPSLLPASQPSKEPSSSRSISSQAGESGCAVM